MMRAKEFTSIGGFVAHMLARDAALVFAMRTGLQTVADAVRDTAKSELGHYQPAVGHFGAWPELADSTKKDRVAQGFTENDPLLRSGDLRESIKNEVSATHAVIGSTSDVAVYQELGTEKMPPRPFLGPAVLHNEEKIKRILGGAIVAGLLGEGVSVPTAMTSKIID
jgi:HK97 gp10 family phage protein